MKRFVALLVVLGVSGLVIGCGGKPTPAPPAKPSMGAAASTATPPAHKPEEKPEAKGDGEEMPAEEGAAEPKEPSEPADPEKKPETETEEKPE